MLIEETLLWTTWHKKGIEVSPLTQQPSHFIGIITRSTSLILLVRNSSLEINIQKHLVAIAVVFFQHFYSMLKN